METSCKQGGEREDGEKSDSMPPLEEEYEGGVSGATKHHKKMKEKHDENVGVAPEEYDEDLYNEEQGGNMDEEEGVAEMYPNELGAGLRRRNRHD